MTATSLSCSIANFPTIRRHASIATRTATTNLALSVFPIRFNNIPGFPYRNGPPVYSGRLGFRVRAVTGDLLRDAGATAAVLGGAYGLVLGFDNLTRRNIIQQNSTSSEARYFAALVPLVNCIKLLVHGLSLVKNESLIKSVTREGNPEELLKGPLYYVLILILCAIAFWRESPVGMVSLAMMCGGDGMADIIGRRFGSTKIFYNRKKSWAGSISMFIFGFLVSIGILYFYSILGFMELDLVSTAQRVALVSLVATLVESLPVANLVDDNISVPLASMVAAYLSFGY